MKRLMTLLLLIGVVVHAELAREESGTMRAELWDAHKQEDENKRSSELKAKKIEREGRVLRFDWKKYGEKPVKGWDLFISLHGGGGAPARVNDSQWVNQIRLGDAYRPKNAIYVAPRAPTNTWNLWHEAHMDSFIDRLISNFVILEDVDPNRVYVMGYSAGGDGVYQLAPRLADRFAGAAMMAGHPNDASPLGLRNLPFALHVGEKDASYNRNGVAAEWKQKLESLQKEDPKGYVHQVQIHEGKGHWMELGDRMAVPWMQEFTRNPYPQRVVWEQDDVLHDSFYWLAVPEGTAKKGDEVVVTRDEQVIRIEKAEGVDTLLIRLNDRMLNLDLPVEVLGPDGKSLFSGKVDRSEEVANRTLELRGDPEFIFFGEIKIEFGNLSD